jgi:hypothetical protein
MNQPDLSIFYLLGGLGFLILAAMLVIASPPHDAGTFLPEAGVALAGILAIVAYAGLRRSRNT